jgi:hypothetical protein
MNEQPSTLYAKLLGETASITWQELQPFFAKGALLWVDPALDLIAVAEAIAEDDKANMATWMSAGQVEKLSDSRALALHEGTPDLWAVVVSPWIVIQNRAS